MVWGDVLIFVFVVGNNHARYRRGKHPRSGSGNQCIDGELVSEFLSLGREERERVVREWNRMWKEEERGSGEDATVESLGMIIEVLNSHCG